MCVLKVCPIGFICKAGQERFRSITRSYYRNSVGALLLYDSTNYDTFEHVAEWLQETKKQIEPNNVIFMLVGSKVDKEHLREVPTEQAQQFADYHNLLFIETSSKTGYNVENAFTLLATQVYDMLEQGKFKIQDGWDGIKSGYIRSNAAAIDRPPPIQLVEANDPNSSSDSSNSAKNAKKGCC